MQYSIVNYDEIAKHKDIRIDSEYYYPIHLHNLKQVKSNNFKLLNEFIIHMSGGFTPLGADYPNQGIPFLRVQNIMPNYLNGDDIKFLSVEQNSKIKRSQLKTDDILLTITGASYGRSAIVTDYFSGANINQHSVKITTKSIEPYFLSTFLNSKYGYSQSTRNTVGITRPALDYYAIRNFLIPDLDKYFQKYIKLTCVKAETLKNNSEYAQQQAQDILLAELGLNDWQSSHQLCFIKNYSDIVKAGRFDAEYFQPKYEEIIQAIKNYKGGWDKLENLVQIKKSVEVGSGKYLEKGIPFIRVSNISPFEISEEKYISEQLYSELTPNEQGMSFEKSKNHQPQQGEILFSKDGSPGIAHYLKEKSQKMIASGGILRLKSNTNEINNEYLTLLLNSVLTQEQMKRDVGGSVILHWRPEQVNEVIIPVLLQEIQLKIQQKVTESFDLRKRSKRLLENAKRAVELAIEKDEQSAIAWLEGQIDTPQI